MERPLRAVRHSSARPDRHPVVAVGCHHLRRDIVQQPEVEDGRPCLIDLKIVEDDVTAIRQPRVCTRARGKPGVSHAKLPGSVDNELL